MKTPKLTDKITVCNECGQASCWLGIYLCADAEYANIKEITLQEALELGLEHPEYMLNDWSLSTGGCDDEGAIILHSLIPDYEDMESDQIKEKLLEVMKEEETK